ncbi:AAA family ATPase [Shinella granuli]|uniref:AAA family ATPase n=1 Tax=Shinella granuli TaxID=323621 RepID=UPI00315C556E
MSRGASPRRRPDPAALSSRGREAANNRDGEFQGGNSQTTTSIHLAHFLGLQGYRVLCIDLDP